MSADPEAPESAPPSRRRRRRLALALLAAPLVLGLYAWQIEPRWGVVSEHRVGQGPRSVRILHVTDLHTSGRGTQERWLLDVVEREAPDLIVITGDTITAHPLPDAIRDAAVALLRELEAPLGVYAVTGNHEEWAGEAGLALYADAGVPLLDGQSLPLLDGRLVLHGVATPRSPVPPATAGYDVALSHYPASLEPVAAQGHELLLAGHSHGGQLQIPGVGPLKLPFDCAERAEGWFELDGTKLFVSRGVGTSVVPLRFACRPELALVTLELPE